MKIGNRIIRKITFSRYFDSRRERIPYMRNTWDRKVYGI